MPLFEYNCPSCNKKTLIDPRGKCQNIMNNGNKCEYEFPLKSGKCNATVRRKWAKHTTPPPSGYLHDYSWIDDSNQYPIYQMETAIAGSVNLDINEKYLFLFIAPSGEYPLAKVLYVTGTDVVSASGVVMPLNSHLNNMHIHFDNYREHFMPIAYGDNLIIQQPDNIHPDEYWVLSGTHTIFKYNQTSNNYCNILESPEF